MRFIHPSGMLRPGGSSLRLLAARVSVLTLTGRRWMRAGLLDWKLGTGGPRGNLAGSRHSVRAPRATPGSPRAVSADVLSLSPLGAA
jgi:hypothetical protein